MLSVADSVAHYENLSSIRSLAIPPEYLSHNLQCCDLWKQYFMHRNHSLGSVRSDQALWRAGISVHDSDELSAGWPQAHIRVFVVPLDLEFYEDSAPGAPA